MMLRTTLRMETTPNLRLSLKLKTTVSVVVTRPRASLYASKRLYIDVSARKGSSLRASNDVTPLSKRR